ncbi:coiled-coil domain-containing protein 187 isoform X1 [Nothobranchius furzeri]|uniref:Transcript variant X4 n=2 Tax=Nothobranchius furzeri TaxID=105023 RepID=A0A9D2XVU6_NOTFU|nr:coiled-coil domain-containing protein 187 isoform X1 [Nothobranchius furzeri]XP_054602302.1 coiled-coil domain-containing protein 187 isoform X1 [Nothobranchius furzeri]XP_054602303.1 coiled-coil domain-containing protein 187 isoform X1 [Nothobranchius furzeri]XP_054602304.1 coiled-coil domain-containing protein 187 isoform X1 [Nothobranchius furzeri]KAF7209255.1 transcript variant X4 [Nothobranchius furzeri]
MAELEIDQSNLPRVREVCQSFAVLEDGVLAHSLQEQEIEQYYTTNIKKNQLVQNDIRVAKRMQDEEEVHLAEHSALLRQTSRQMEEQDFEYAREIQEEIQRCAEEDRRRELDDEEMAKRLQEEEEGRRSRGQESPSEGSSSDPALSAPHQHAFSNHREGRYSPTAARWRCSPSHNGPSLTGAQSVSPRRRSAHINPTSWSTQGHTDSNWPIGDEVRESEDSEDSDTVFNKQLSLWSRRLYERPDATNPQQKASLRQLPEKKYRRPCSRSSLTGEVKQPREERKDCWENGDLQNRVLATRRPEISHRDEYENWHRTWSQNTDRSTEVRDGRCRSESVRLHNRNRPKNGDLSRTWSYKDTPDKRVRFQEDDKQDCKQRSESNRVWEMLGHILEERGVPVRIWGSGAPLQIGPQSRDSQVLHGSEVSYGDSQPHQRAFQRAGATRHSFHGDIRERRRLSHRENSGRDQREDPHRHHLNGEVCEMNRRDSYIVNGEQRGSKRWKEHKYTNSDENGDRSSSGNGARRTTSERRHWHRIREERLSSEEEQEVERRVERPRRRSLQRSQSLRSSRHGSKREAAGACLEAEPREAGLYLGELQQVLQDEELARRLQEEEEKLMKRVSPSPPRGLYPAGDFRVAQVAQDEEIARFMQKQEMKSKRRSRELEGPGSWHEHRAMISQHDRRAARERQVPVQRERLDSEGLPSPTEDCFPENQPPSPVTTMPKAQEVRNVAEELDPTFQARRQSTGNFPTGHADPSSSSLPVAPSGLHDFLEEPTFIPPTKRQTEKPARSRPKEKKEGCKQQ